MHKAQTIRDEVLNRLEVLKSAGDIAQIIKHRGVNPENHPCVSVTLGPDTPLTENSNYIDSTLEIYTDVYIIESDQDLDSKMLDVRAAIHKALFSEYNLGLDFILKVTPLGQLAPENSGEGDQYTGATRLAWGILYRSAYTDPTK